MGSCPAIVEHGNFLKFSQNKRLRKTLLETGNKTLVEAARNDSIWGIGVSVKDAAAGAKWKGLNSLGCALMTARTALAEGHRRPPPAFPDLPKMVETEQTNSAAGREANEETPTDASGRASVPPQARAATLVEDLRSSPEDVAT